MFPWVITLSTGCPAPRRPSTYLTTLFSVTPTSGKGHRMSTLAIVSVPETDNVTKSLKERMTALTAPVFPSPSVNSLFSKPPRRSPPSSSVAAAVPSTVIPTISRPGSPARLMDQPWTPISAWSSAVIRVQSIVWLKFRPDTPSTTSLSSDEKPNSNSVFISCPQHCPRKAMLTAVATIRRDPTLMSTPCI